MAYITRPTESLVKFVRGTKQQFAQITKENDVLYFVYDSNDSTTGELWLGNKQIGDGGVDSLSSLISGEAQDGNLLVYDAVSQDWVQMSPDEAIRTMSGATLDTAGQSGFVPVPQAGDQDKFLKGDGTWSEVPSNIVSVDEKSLVSVENVLSLNGYETAAVGTIPQKSSTGITWVNPSISGGLSYTKVSSLDEVTQEATIYLVPNGNSTGNLYDEYMFLDGKAELIGNSSQAINLDNYVTNEIFNTKVSSLETSISTLETKVSEVDTRLTWQEMIEE